MTDKYARAAGWLTDKYIICMLLIFPLFVGFQGYADITLSKYLFFVITSTLWLISIIALAVLSGKSLRLRRWEAVALGFALWATLSSMVSPNAAESLLGASRYDGLVTILLYVGIFIGVSRFGAWRKRYAWFMAAALTGCCAVALFQLFGFSIFYPNGYTYYDGGVKYISKFLGTIGNTNLLAAYLCLGIPLLASSYVLSKRGGETLLAAASLGVFIMVVSESSGGTLALFVSALCAAFFFARAGVLPRAFHALAVLMTGAAAAGLFVFEPAAALCAALAIWVLFFFGWLFDKKIRPGLHKRIIVLLIIAGIIILFFTAYYWQGSKGTMYELSRLMHGEIRDEFGSSRICIWRQTLALVPERLIFGGGPGTLALRLDVSFSRYFDALGETLTTYTDNAHNVYLGYLVNLGVPGLLIYLSLIAVTLQQIVKASKKHVIAIGCVLICAWVEAFFGLGLCLVAPMMWIFWGLVFCPVYKSQKIFEVYTHDEAEKADDSSYRTHCPPDTLPHHE